MVHCIWWKNVLASKAFIYLLQWREFCRHPIISFGLYLLQGINAPYWKANQEQLWCALLTFSSPRELGWLAKRARVTHKFRRCQGHLSRHNSENAACWPCTAVFRSYSINSLLWTLEAEQVWIIRKEIFKMSDRRSYAIHKHGKITTQKSKFTL